MRLDREEDPTVAKAFLHSVDWPSLPRVGEGHDIGRNNPQTIESVGHDFDGDVNVFLGSIMLDDLQAAQLRKPG